MHIVPIYHDGDDRDDGNDVLVTHELDFTEGEMVDDGLCICISLRHPRFTPVNRGQNFLRFGQYSPILIDERQKWVQRIEESLPADMIREIEQLIEFPTPDLMKQLNFVAPRLRKPVKT
jgi:hypothetical protein